MSEYDVLIVGAGQAGVPLARRLAKEGRRVVIAERKHLGGSCVNFGCTPTKAVIASARVAHLARRAADFGIVLPEPKVDFTRVIQRARQLTEDAKASLAKGLAECGAEVLRGQARLSGSRGDGFVFTVDEREAFAKQIVINTGTRTLMPKIDGLNEVPYLDAGNWLRSKSLPQHVIFAGAGYIALEMAQFYRRLGSSVTVVDPGKQIADREDADVADALQKCLEDEGISFQTETQIAAVTAGSGELRVSLTSKGKASFLEGTHLFIATGRQPNTDDLALDTVGVETDKHGFIKVNDRLATSVPGIWAAGDVRGGPMFTHTSWDDHRVLESQLLGDGKRTTAGRVVPYAVFTDPELGRVGLTEAEARQQHGDAVRVANYAMNKNGKASEQSETLGFIKLIADARDHRLLGAAVLSVDGGELVGPLITLMNAKASIDVLRDGIFIHPTLTEAVQSAALALDLS